MYDYSIGGDSEYFQQIIGFNMEVIIAESVVNMRIMYDMAYCLVYV